MVHLATDLRGLAREMSGRQRRRAFMWVGILVAATADHGQGLGSHGFGGHGGQIWNEQVQAPLLMHFADRESAGLEVDGVVRHVDLLPTLMELADLDQHHTGPPTEGQSLGPLLRVEQDERRLAFSQRRPPGKPHEASERPGDEMIAIQSTTHKYIRDGQRAEHLFDLRVDPLEMRNLIGQNEPAEDFLRRELDRIYERLDSGVSQSRDLDIKHEHIQELRALGYID